MRRCRVVLCALCALCSIGFTAPRPVRAQFYAYPSFQVPQTADREFNFGVADASRAGTTFVFQWREFFTARSHLQLDAGLANPARPSDDTRFVIGGGYAYRVNSATADLPLDMVFTVGLGGSFGGANSVVRIPLGLSVGHRFATDGPVFITPYAHPRLSLDSCSRCRAGRRGNSNLGMDVDLGVGAEFGPSISVRASFMINGSRLVSQENGFGISLAWLPPGVR
jgi:hypothetical protein